MLIVSKIGMASVLDHMHPFIVQFLGTTLTVSTTLNKTLSATCTINTGMLLNRNCMYILLSTSDSCMKENPSSVLC